MKTDQPANVSLTVPVSLLSDSVGCTRVNSPETPKVYFLLMTALDPKTTYKLNVMNKSPGFSFPFPFHTDHVVFACGEAAYLPLSSGPCSLGLIDQRGSDSMKPITEIAHIWVVFCS